ncbi:MAG: CotH kinase family protein [Bacteroidales bacterium]|nr:CotH kinase family protein [Candidatus Cacconaster merdequi]
MDKIESEVYGLKMTVSALQDAYSQGKVIKSVSPIADSEGGWIVAFSDNTEIRLRNGEDGTDGTLFLKVDQNGNWTISYDNGSTFVLLENEEGNPICVYGPDDSEGLSVRVAVGSDGNYVIQSYRESDPSIVIDEIATSSMSDAGRVITSISQNDERNVISITLADGTSFTFDMSYISPTGIVLLDVNPLRLSYGSRDTMEFRVNPSNALFKLNGKDCQLELDKVGEVITRSSYVTAPSNYRLVEVKQVYDEKTKEIKVGQYIAIIEDAGQSALYDEMAALVLNVKDARGNDVQISSSAFEVTGKYYESILNTGLPVVIIDTPDNVPITSKETWVEDASMTIVNPDMSVDYQGTLSIKGRGNSTWNLSPKKPFALKLNKKEKILGMKKHKRWCLLANWMDRTMMRNAVAFEISRNTGLAWTPSGKFVEVVLNGRHIGNYYLCEQIKVDENRVDIEELDPSATSGEGITGGYIFELDTNYDELYKFRPTRSNFPWMFKDPDEVNESQFNWTVNYVERMEESLYDETKFSNREFEDYLDLESFVDYWLVNELAMNNELNHPKSSYMHKDVGGKMIAGPVWDYDYGTFRPEATSVFRIKSALYYPQLFEDPSFVALVKTRWILLKPKFETNIPAFIDDLEPRLKASDELNAPMWPISGQMPNGDETMSYEDAVERLKSAYLQKLNWLDSQIMSW